MPNLTILSFEYYPLEHHSMSSLAQVRADNDSLKSYLYKQILPPRVLCQLEAQVYLTSQEDHRVNFSSPKTRTLACSSPPPSKGKRLGLIKSCMKCGCAKTNFLENQAYIFSFLYVTTDGDILQMHFRGPYYKKLHGDNRLLRLPS